MLLAHCRLEDGPRLVQPAEFRVGQGDLIPGKGVRFGAEHPHHFLCLAFLQKRHGEVNSDP